MNNYILKTTNLSKKYSDVLAVDKVNMSIKKGSIYGFIGQNGAGKSTFFRLVCNLAYPNEGTIELFGLSQRKNLIEARKRIGSIIENPALYPHMTATENIEAHRLLKGVPGKECIKESLALVGLENTGKKKVKNFSQGMKQRLGIALALLGNPEFLILDEPINGLDPMGVIEVRELLKKLNVELGITILISSHILSELYLLATHYGIIHNGVLLEQLTAKQLDEKCMKYLHIKVDNPEKAIAILERQLNDIDLQVIESGVIRLYSKSYSPGKVSKVLADEGLMIEEFMPMGSDLETYFKNLIGGYRNE